MVFRVFRGKKHPSFTIAPFPRPYGLEPSMFLRIEYQMVVLCKKMIFFFLFFNDFFCYNVYNIIYNKGVNNYDYITGY